MLLTKRSKELLSEKTIKIHTFSFKGNKKFVQTLIS